MQLQENKSIGDPTTQSTTSCVSSHKIGDSCANVEVKPGEEKEDICSSVCRPAEVEGNNGGGATPLEDKLDTRGQVSGISTDGKPNLTSPSMDRNKSFECDREEIGDGSICTSNIKIGDGSDCTAASGRKLQKLLVEDPMSGPVGKEELGSASATDQQQLPSLDAVDESVVAVVSLTADNVPSPKAVDESMTRKSENSGIDYFKLGDVAKEKNSISTSSIDEPPTSKIAGEVKEVHESYPVGSKGQEPPTSMIKEIENCEKTIGFNFKTSGFNADRRGELASSTESCSCYQ